jgi:hypothetical protein
LLNTLWLATGMNACLSQRVIRENGIEIEETDLFMPDY